MEGLVIHVANKLAEKRFGKEHHLSLFSFHELKTWVFWRAVIAEALGTALFVYMGVSSTVLLSSNHKADIVQVRLEFFKVQILCI